MSDETLEINGWTIYAHPLFLDQLEAVIGAAEKSQKKDPRERDRVGLVNDNTTLRAYESGDDASEARHVEETSRPSVKGLLSGESLSASDHEDRADEQQQPR